MEQRYPLKYGCVAHVVIDDSDRPPYVPPPIPKYEHAPNCGCGACVAVRDVNGRKA